METETAPAADRKAVLARLRAEYQELHGKPAPNFWGVEELTSRNSVKRAADKRHNGMPLPGQAEERVSAVVTADHVFLPLDEDGNVPDEWRNVPGPVDTVEGMSNNERLELAHKLDTKPVPKRTRLTMPRSCANFLSQRDQIEVL